MPTGRRRQFGFTYIGLLIAVAFFGLATVGAGRLLGSTERAEREADLLFVGNQFRQAIISYLQSGTKAGQYPATLEDLVLDPRYPTPRRHLRKVFADPITGETKWGLVLAPEGGIMGVYSLSELEPLKRANFEPENEHFAMALRQPLVASKSTVSNAPIGAQTYSYRDWKFVDGVVQNRVARSANSLTPLILH